MGVIVEGKETIEQLLYLDIILKRDFPEQQVTIKEQKTGLEITGFRLGLLGGENPI